MYDSTITVFNLHKGLWLPRVIHDVDIGAASGSNATALNGTTNADTAIVLIPSNANKDITANGQRMIYAAPKKFAALENVENVITFQPQTDFIIIGEYESVKPVVDDDFESGFYDAVNGERDGVYQITSVEYYSLIPHFEIGAK